MAVESGHEHSVIAHDVPEVEQLPDFEGYKRELVNGKSSPCRRRNWNTPSKNSGNKSFAINLKVPGDCKPSRRRANFSSPVVSPAGDRINASRSHSLVPLQSVERERVTAITPANVSAGDGCEPDASASWRDQGRGERYFLRAPMIAIEICRLVAYAAARTTDYESRPRRSRYCRPASEGALSRLK